MKGKKGNFDTYYNIQLGCSENQIITYNKVVVDGNDRMQLIPAIEGIQANTGQKVAIVVADADYGTFDSFEYMDKEGVCGYVPYREMNATFEDQAYHKVHFIYDPSSDTYTCPAKQRLTFRTIRKIKKQNIQYRQYRTKACKSCPFHQQCCSKKAIYRTIEREVRQELRDQMKQRLNSEEGRKIYLRRLHPIEAIFGHLKYNLGYTHFLLRGLDKVKAEFNLMCLAYNLCKLARHFLKFWLPLATPGLLRGQKLGLDPIFQRTCIGRM